MEGESLCQTACQTPKQSLKKNRILLGCTGSVASIKIPEIINHLLNINYDVDIQLVTTENACHFFKPEDLPVTIHRDEHEWQSWQKRGDPVLHIELRRWADMLVIAPLDANTMAKIASGLCDNLLTCVVRAWDLDCPLLFAPAMNTFMWEHPLTEEHLTRLKGLGYREIPCVEKTLVCGDRGFGAMAEVSTIVNEIGRVLEEINGKS